MKFFRSFIRLPLFLRTSRWRVVPFSVVIAGLVSPLVIDWYIAASARSQCTAEISEVEDRRVALVLGTARSFNGRMNAFYTNRIAAAAELFEAGKVRGILVSGDNGSECYDEPTDMRDDLVAAGVPEEFITLDYAGFRTRDSIIRAKEVFGQDDFIIVTQRFHAERALFVARELGIDARAFIAADPVSRVSNAKVRVRETLARTLAFADRLISRQPRFLGEPELVALAGE